MDAKKEKKDAKTWKQELENPKKPERRCNMFL